MGYQKKLDLINIKQNESYSPIGLNNQNKQKALTSPKPAVNNSLYSCLRPDIKVTDLVYTEINGANRISLGEKLNQLKASCNQNDKLTSALGKEIYFYREQSCSGIRPDNYDQIRQKAFRDMASLSQTYEVVEITCNPTGVLIP